jgi:hypothetical protein
MKSAWITHKSVDIFYVDLADFHLNRAGLKAELEAVLLALSQTPEESVIGLVDTRHTVLSMAMTVIIHHRCVPRT